MSSPEFSEGEAPAEKVTEVSGTGIPVRGNDIDTDQIIPARFMKVVTFDGLGQFSFFDQRFDDDNEKDHPFNEEQYQGANVLVVNATAAVARRVSTPAGADALGIDAVVGESFAEIFAGNCLALGIPTVTADQEDIEALQDFVEANPNAEVDIDVAAETITYGDTVVDATVHDAQRKALVEGVWDTTALMMGANEEAVRETARSLPYVPAEDIPGTRREPRHRRHRGATDRPRGRSGRRRRAGGAPRRLRVRRGRGGRRGERADGRSAPSGDVRTNARPKRTRRCSARPARRPPTSSSRYARRSTRSSTSGRRRRIPASTRSSRRLTWSSSARTPRASTRATRTGSATTFRR